MRETGPLTFGSTHRLASRPSAIQASNSGKATCTQRGLACARRIGGKRMDLKGFFGRAMPMIRLTPDC